MGLRIEGLEEAGGFSRRTFFKGAALAGAAVAGSAIVSGCQPQANEHASAAERAGNAGDVAAAEINPQDEGYTSCTTDFSALFQPLTIGDYTMPNRLCKSSAGSDTALLEEVMPFEGQAFYENFAKGGIGMIWCEQCGIWPEEEISMLSAGREEDIEHWKPFVEMCHGYGVPVGGQLLGDFTRFSSSKSHYSPLDIENQNSNVPMTTDEVKDMRDHVITAAYHLQQAGFDAVELNASCSHTFDSFVSRFWNTERDDEYGGQSIENRARFITEMISGIREKCGPGFGIQVLYSAIEENVAELGDSDLCMKKEEAVEFAKLFEAAGASSLHIRSSIFGNHAAGFMTDMFNVPVPGHTGLGTVADFSRHMDGQWQGQYDGVAAFLKSAANIKKNVSIPVGTVGCMDARLAPDLINDAIADGEIDFVLMTRPLLADPSFAAKLKDGRRDEIAPCNHCMTCFAGSLAIGTPMHCRANPAMARAYTADMPEGYEPLPAEESKNVLVIGGGPAGMEAAHTAARRGHRVTLCEKKADTGGMLSFAASVKGTHEKIADYRAYLQRQLEVQGIEVIANQEVDADFVASKAPDAVIVATGAQRSMITAPGSDLPHVTSIENYATMEFGASVVLVGAGIQAIDFAIHLVKQGISVTVVHEGPEEDVDKHCPAWIKHHNLNWLRAQGTQVYSNATISEITEDQVAIGTDYGTVVQIAADTVVSCIDMQPNDGLYLALKDTYETYLVGDAKEPSTIAHASATGNLAARSISAPAVDYVPKEPKLVFGDGAGPAGAGADTPSA
ncbi:FAD-dependent oxidoreductase [Eggerthella guodeyinii]|uniref:FAD-dependent oxidoreductase n=1 Tax=Eggerthella guodeyinii TaxID=2690837 RepID=A0A6L7IZA2_9ACTN|nr:FAD-dependent oxidoreductase [Eggerthella guodeyinii]QOS69471.1 FAD-dependent oxidoreductase [Eggerthella guodeyinii]